MSRVKNKNTKPEILVRQFLYANGFRYRLHKKDLPGKPDIVLPKYKTVIFVNGCFWHGHRDCKFATIPETNHDFWLAKINSNVERDKNTFDALKEAGWKVIVVWQCQLKTKTREETLKNLITEIRR